MTEQWLPIPGYEGLYDVSDHGNVRSWKRYRGRPAPRLRATPVGGGGYRTVVLTDADGRNKTWNVHHLVAVSFYGPKGRGVEIRHLDGDNQNNRLTNLRYGTASENGLDSVRHGTNIHSRKTHCPRNHPYDEANTLPSRDGRRRCKTCDRARRRPTSPVTQTEKVYS